jgi:hypothetical protein
MKERITKLLAVKSIVTIFATLVFCYMSIIGVLSSEQFMTVFTMIISFYFCTQNEKKNKDVTDHV